MVRARPSRPARRFAPPQSNSSLLLYQSTGPFKICMHDLEDLVLHSWSVKGVKPLQAGGGEEGETPVVIHPGINS